MGKVTDERLATKPAKPKPKGGGPPSMAARIAPFFINLVKSDSYKAQQGWYARLWTAIGLGALVLAGIYRAYVTFLLDEAPLLRIGLPVLLAAVFGWLVFRFVQFPPFVDFLIATEAEMNKVSWTTKAELKRATIVVLVTVLLLATYLFVVDEIWVYLLKLIRVLSFGDSSTLGSDG